MTEHGGVEGLGGDQDLVVALLTESRAVGFLGPGPVEPHVAHAQVFADALTEVLGGAPATVVDLGAGGGLPCLPLLRRAGWEATRWLLVEANGRRSAFLREASGRLGAGDRVTVAPLRAEEAGRQPTWRGQFQALVSRSFGPPMVVAECGAPFLAPGGILVASEPPGAPDPDRWPTAGLVQVGLALVERREAPAGSVVVLRQEIACPERFPRRNGVPTKRPLA